MNFFVLFIKLQVTGIARAKTLNAPVASAFRRRRNATVSSTAAMVPMKSDAISLRTLRHVTSTNSDVLMARVV